MLQIIALLLGLISWGLMICSIIRRKKITKENRYVLYVLSWIFCAITTYMPSLCLYIEREAEDYSAVIDTVGGYYFAATIALAVTAGLTIISVLLNRKK